MKLQYVAIIAVVSLLVGRFVLQPKAKVEVHEKIKTVEVIKEIKVEVEKKKTRTEIVTKPDGTTVTVIDETVDSSSNTITNSNISKESEKSTKSSSGVGVLIGALILKDLDKSSQNNYGITVTAPIYNSLKIQAIGTTDKRIGIGLALEF